jgi:cytochrome c
MPQYFHRLIVCLTLIFSISFITACDREKPVPSAPATATEVAPASEQQEVATESTGTVESKDEPQATAEITPALEEQTPPSTPPETAVAATVAPTAKAADTSTHADALALARKSGCLACHAVDKKVVGPAWQDVAKRYAGKADARAQLIEKVSKGGKGNWTDVVGTAAMPPYYPRVSNENIEQLVDFVLSLAEQ